MLAAHFYRSKSINITKRDQHKFEITVDKSEINTGTLMQGESKKYTVHLKNTAITGSLQIKKISASCSCLNPKISTLLISQGGEATLTFDVISGSSSKYLNEQIIIEYINTSKHDIYSISIPINGKVESIAEISERRMDLKINDISPKVEKGKLSVLHGTSSNSWTHMTVSVKPKIADCKVFSNVTNNQVEIIPQINLLSFGDNQAQIVFEYYNSIGKKIFDDYIPLNIKYSPPVNICPNSFYFSDTKNGVIVSRVLRLDCPQDIDVTAIQSSNKKLINIHLDSKRNGVYTYTLTIIPKEPGMFCESINISFLGKHSGTVSIPVVGIVDQIN
jgi:hypothetical protein